MEFCTKCGNKLEEHWFICPKCGMPLKEIDKPKQEAVISQQEIKTPQKTTIINKSVNKEKEKRFVKNKRVLALSISLVVVCVLAGVFGISFLSIDDKYNDLSGEYNELLNNYQIMTGDYDTLFDNYQDLQNSYDAICSMIKQSILPVQYSIFAEAVRRYYMPIYLDASTTKEQYMGYVEFCRDIILHDSRQYNAFSEVSDAFSDALRYGSDTMHLAWHIMYWTFWDWLPDWDVNLIFNELWGIDAIVDWCIDEIDYEYDNDITDGQEYFNWDYPKFPVETAFRTMGDCEDQAILTAAYLESCGFETAISMFHDPSHPTIGEFYHTALLVHIEDTDAFWSLYPDCLLWYFPEIDPYPPYTWCVLDTTWDVPFGSIPFWLQDYIDFGMTEGIVSDAICDIDGGID